MFKVVYWDIHKDCKNVLRRSSYEAAIILRDKLKASGHSNVYIAVERK